MLFFLRIDENKNLMRKKKYNAIQFYNQINRERNKNT